MGQKINPVGFRIGITKNWTSRWFFPGKGEAGAKGKYSYAQFLAEDEAIRRIVRKKIAQAGIAGIEIERTSNNLRILIKAARPGFVIGQGGKGIEELTRAIHNELRNVEKSQKRKKSTANVSVNVEELKRSEVSAAYTAQQIAWDLERRMPFRRTTKKYLDQIMQNKEVKGAKLLLSGRLDGAEIARHEAMKKGQLPLQTLRTDIDYGTATAFTTFGTVGIKAWIYRGEVFANKAADERNERHESENTRQPSRGPRRSNFPNR